eukprot:5511282-Pyramimonas_sp.AAC.1
MSVVAGRRPPPRKRSIVIDLPWGRRLDGPWDFLARPTQPGPLPIPRSGPLPWLIGSIAPDLRSLPPDRH